MIRTKLALITILMSLSLTGCLTDETKTIDESTEIRDDNDGPQDPDVDTDDNGCRLLKNGELDCPEE